MIFLDDIVVSENYTREYAERRLLVHAELNALMDADRMQYSIGQRRRMQLFTNLEPCLMCMGAAMSFCVERSFMRWNRRPTAPPKPSGLGPAGGGCRFTVRRPFPGHSPG